MEGKHGASKVQFKDRKIYTDLMFMLGLSEPIDQMAMVKNVRWHGHVLRREDGHVLRRALDFEDDGQRKKGRLKRTCKMQVEEERVKVGLKMEDELADQSGVLVKLDCCRVEMNLATLTCWGYYQILNINVSLPYIHSTCMHRCPGKRLMENSTRLDSRSTRQVWKSEMTEMNDQ